MLRLPYNENGYAVYGTTRELCCADEDADGAYEACGLLSDVGVFVDDGLGGTLQVCPSDPTLDPYLPLSVSAACQSYENEFVFNIADFVGYLWDIDSTGAYLVRIRFYPIP